MKCALKHIATPNLGYASTAQLAPSIECVGVEFGNDLAKLQFPSPISVFVLLCNTLKLKFELRLLQLIGMSHDQV
jgi:hypothetical protein